MHGLEARQPQEVVRIGRASGTDVPESATIRDRDDPDERPGAPAQQEFYPLVKDAIEADVHKILGGKFLRVFSAVWK